MMNKRDKNNTAMQVLLPLGLVVLTSVAYASSSLTLGSMASTITQSFTGLTKLITGGSYVAGLGFAVGAIIKFKAHKDNPTQITIGVPVSLTAIAAALLFLPTVLNMAGDTMFGSGAQTSGPTGSVFSSS